MNYVYVLLLSNRKLYVGYSNNLQRRFKEHIAGKVKSTRNTRPMKLVFYEAFQSKHDAMRREKYFKTTKGKSSLKQILRESIQ